MANIPVHPAKRGVPWWLWLLIALLIAAVIAFFLLVDEEDDGGEASRLGVDNTEVTAEPRPDVSRRATLTSLDSIPAPGDPRVESFLGRDVDLERARVSRVLGDSAFVVRNAAGRDMLVVLYDPTGTSAAGSARGFAVEDGDTVQITGALLRAKSGLARIPQAARASIRNGELFVAARADDVTSADMIPAPDTAPPPPPTDAEAMTDTTITT